ncbi:MAG: Gfo/Idh/MocA family oxidoreductase [Planctomycetaceae bacterium]|jgi:predicted dehydrogenase|nr:Gfo/Idh/MocA family oxidoreductase [Planctomycetaceae bacterium]
MAQLFSSRRNFLKTGSVSALALGAAMAVPRIHAAENNTLKIGLVGCGGRGRGAVADALKADANTKVVAVCDAFPENAKRAVEGLKNSPFADRIDVTPETTFDGLDAYKKVIDLSDVVLLCETPHFRPRSFKYAIEQGKHVFCEKPAAVDAPGVREVQKSCELAREKKLNVVAGLCWRYDLNVKEMMKLVHDGAIGDVLTVRENYLTSKLWTRSRVEGDSELKFQVRNWYNYTWLSGDFNTEQHIHSLDKALWCFHDEAPETAYAVGGRMARTEQPAFGDIYDSMGVVYEYSDGRAIVAFCRQMNGCFNDVDDYFTGTKGTAQILRGEIKDREGKVTKRQKKQPSAMYVLEHEALFGAIRSGGKTYINDGDSMVKSTFIAILGRQAVYTGKRIKWEEEWNSTESLAPDGYTWDSKPPVQEDEKGRYPLQVAGLGKVYHQITR